jgi:hypothetical protein
MDGGTTTVCTYYSGVAVGGRTAYIPRNIPRAPMSIYAWVRGKSALSGQGTYTGIYLPKIKQAFGQKINRIGKDGRITRVKKSKVTRWSNEKSAFVKKRETLQVRYKVKEFIKKFPIGKYIVIVNAHAFALVEGEVMGNWNDSKRLNREVWSAYKVK